MTAPSRDRYSTACISAQNRRRSIKIQAPGEAAFRPAANTKEEGIHMYESRCGVRCDSCGRKGEVNCTGCINMKTTFWGGTCTVKSCCESRSLNHCGECPDFPCAMCASMGEEMGFDPKPRLEALRQWAAEGKTD